MYLELCKTWNYPNRPEQKQKVDYLGLLLHLISVWYTFLAFVFPAFIVSINWDPIFFFAKLISYLICYPDLLDFFTSNLAILFIRYLYATFFVQGAFANFRTALLFCTATGYEFVQQLQRILSLVDRRPFEAVKRYRIIYVAFCHLFPLAYEIITFALPFCFIMFVVCSNVLIFVINPEHTGTQIVILFYAEACFGMALTIFTLGCWILSNSESIHCRLKKDQTIL